MAQLHCHCSTAHRLGAKPAPAPGLFPPDANYLSIVDEEGRLWLWVVEDAALAEAQDHQAKPVG
jgi:hypothetical protein